MLALALLLFAGTPPAAPTDAAGLTADALADRLAPHPRLVLTPGREAALREKIRTAPWAAELEGELHALADELVAGGRFQGWRPKGWELASTGAVPRIAALALVHRLHGGEKYLREAERSLRQIAREVREPDVGVEYLKRAAVLTALGLGFDWLHDDLSPDTLDEIERGILEGGALDLLRREKYRIPGNNWTTVCYGGTAVACLAIAERQPDLAAEAVTRAARRLPAVTAQYLPDGIGFEGPHYWDFPSVYHALLTDSLRTAVGDDLGLATAPGLRASFDWRLAARGPGGDDFNYGDGERANRAVQAFAWAAGEYGLDHLVTRADLRRMVRKPERFREKSWMAFPLIWLPADAVDRAPPDGLLLFRGGGPSAQAIVRSAWGDPHALWLAVKAGRANVSHGHMDAGSVVLELGGVRWFEETVTHHYFDRVFTAAGITDIWSFDDPGSDRWRVYAWNNRGHNTLTAGDAPHDPNAEATVVRADTGDPGGVTVTLDLADVLGDAVTAAARTCRVPDGRTVVVEDSWTASGDPFTMTARLHTSASVERDGDRRAVLTKDGRRLALEVLSPGDAALAVAPADAHLNPWDRRLPGVTAVDLTVPTAPGTDRTLRWRVRLDP